MGPLIVVFPHPLRTVLAHLIPRLEHVSAEHLLAERPIEPSHKGILIRLAQLNIPQHDPSVCTPTRKASWQEVWPLIDPNHRGNPLPACDLVEHPDVPLGGRKRFLRSHPSAPRSPRRD